MIICNVNSGVSATKFTRTKLQATSDLLVCFEYLAIVAPVRTARLVGASGFPAIVHRDMSHEADLRIREMVVRATESFFRGAAAKSR